MKKGVLLLFVTALGLLVEAQKFIPLWPAGKKPNSTGKNVTDSIYNQRYWRVGTPGMFAFPALQSENSGATVLICPGGGYDHVTHLFNGFNFAHWFNAHGVNAYVLVYRLPNQTDLNLREQGPLADAQRALKILKANAARWGLAKNKIGVMGISAGGHVATTLGTHVDDVSTIRDSLDTVSTRPDFLVLLSPVVTMGRYAHGGSRKNFLGVDTTSAMIARYSNELQVKSTTPPSFLVHAQNDNTVNVRNSLFFFNALIENGVPASLHVFPQGGHGIGLIDNPGSTDLWLNLLDLWLREKRFIEPTKK